MAWFEKQCKPCLLGSRPGRQPPQPLPQLPERGIAARRRRTLPCPPVSPCFKSTQREPPQPATPSLAARLGVDSQQHLIPSSPLPLTSLLPVVPAPLALADPVETW
jgi:hypothetical protein